VPCLRQEPDETAGDSAAASTVPLGTQRHLTSEVLLLPNPKKANRDPSGDWHSHARRYVHKWPLSPSGLPDLWSRAVPGRYGDSERLDLESEEMAILTCPDCGVKVQPEDLICFRCGANLPHTPYADDDIPSPTVSQQYVQPPQGRPSCPNCGTPVQDPADVVCMRCRQPLPGRRPISPVVLRIGFPTGNVDVPAGTQVVLGRDPAQSLVAAAFAQYDNISRRHATVMVDDGGRAVIRDEGSTNGTFVNGDRVLPGAEVRLVDGDRIRLAADVTGDVTLPRSEPDPASYSRNGYA